MIWVRFFLFSRHNLFDPGFTPGFFLASAEGHQLLPKHKQYHCPRVLQGLLEQRQLLVQASFQSWVQELLPVKVLLVKRQRELRHNLTSRKGH